MWFDCIKSSTFTTWYSLSFGASYTLSVSENGYEDEYGTTVPAWGFYYLDDEDDSSGDNSGGGDDNNTDTPTEDGVLLSLKGDANQAFIMEINDDGTYYFSFTTYNASEEGTWKMVQGQLVLTCNDTVNYSKLNDDGTYTIEYISNRSAQMTQNYTVSKSDWNKAFANTKNILLDLTGDANQAFIMEIYEDGTYYFSFTTYNASESGTWKMVQGQLVLTCNDTVNYSKLNDDGTYTIEYISNRSKQMTQNYTVSVSDWDKAFANTKNILLDLTGDANQAFIMEIYEDGTYYFCFTTYNASESGTWTIENGELKFDCNSTINYSTADETGKHIIAYISNRSSAMTQNYTISADAWQIFYSNISEE
jgi:hypothetical protein